MIEDTSAQDVVLTRELNRKKIAFIVILGLIAVLGLSWALPHYSQVVTADLVVTEDSLRLSTVRRGELLLEIVAQGRVVAANSPTLFSTEQGFIDLQVQAGDRVHQGQVLATVLSPDLNELYEQEISSLSRIKNELERQLIQVKRNKFELQQTEDLAQVNLITMEREKRRADESFEREIISLLDFELARDELDRAKLVYKQAKQNNSLEQELLDFDIKTIKIKLESQRLSISSLERRIKALSIVSPLNGVIGNVQIQQRQAVSANQPLITVVDLSAFEIEASVTEGYADDLAPLMGVSIKLEGKNYPGELTAISPEVINSQVVVRIRFTATVPPNLRQNQRLSANIILEHKDDVLLVDRGSFVDTFDGTVFMKEGDQAVRIPVILGSRSLRHIEIIDGLEAGTEIIVSALAADRDTQEILITK